MKILAQKLTKLLTMEISTEGINTLAYFVEALMMKKKTFLYCNWHYSVVLIFASCNIKPLT